MPGALRHRKTWWDRLRHSADISSICHLYIPLSLSLSRSFETMSHVAPGYSETHPVTQAGLLQNQRHVLACPAASRYTHTVLPACMSVHHVHAWCMWRPRLSDPQELESPFLATVSTLRIEPRSSGREILLLTLSPQPLIPFNLPKTYFTFWYC